ncbi:MAG: PTS transporter subunit EIIC [Suipraeoptans sp.]
MKKFIDWLSNVFAPAMSKLFKRPWFAGVSSAMQKIIPFILTGSVVFFYNVFRSYIPVLPDIGPIASYSFFLLSLIVCFMITNQIMEKLKHPRYTITAALVSICTFLMFVKPEAGEDSIMLVDWDRLGPSGVLVAMVVGLFVAFVFNLYAKIPWLRDSNIPDFVVGWIHNVIPIFATLGISSLIIHTANIDLFDVILAWFEPVAKFGQTLPGFILLILVPTIFLTMGISTWTFSAVQNPIFFMGIQANIAAVAAGGVATNIVTSETIYTAALITMGGTGATLLLNILMMFSKSKSLKAMGRICIAPSIFNINEPIVFGTPVVFNPLLMLPMWINSITGPTIVWIFMRSGLLNIPSKMIQVGQIPAPFSSVMITEDWRAIICYIVLFGVYLVTWLPFFKAYEKQKLQEELQEVVNETN